MIEAGKPYPIEKLGEVRHDTVFVYSSGWSSDYFVEFIVIPNDDTDQFFKSFNPDNKTPIACFRISTNQVPQPAETVVRLSVD